MNRLTPYLLVKLAIFSAMAWIIMGCSKQENDFSDRVKLSLRIVGDQTLLANKDSTSLVLPILELENSRFEISFEKQLSIEPGELVLNLQSSLQLRNISTNYRVSVYPCGASEVVYSYESVTQKETADIPCKRRVLPKSCYTIQVQFMDIEKEPSGDWMQYFIAVIIAFSLIIGVGFFYFYKKKKTPPVKKDEISYLRLGAFQFYPEQLQLIYKKSEIPLSKKECELLIILIDNISQIVKREELSKRVWEDQGVVVGRSLDTFISRLRKKLALDPSIKISNIHGVGYKLEV